MTETELRGTVWEPGVKGILERLGDREMHVLYDLATRLHEGQKLYGRLTPNKKNWLKEAYEESLDRAIYDSCNYVDLMESKDGRGTP